MSDGLELQSASAEALMGHIVDDFLERLGRGERPEAEEYARQHYEGGHTLFGPRTQPFLTAHAARLARAVAHDGYVSELASPHLASMLVGCSSSSPMNGRLHVWHPMSPIAPVPKSMNPRQFWL